MQSNTGNRELVESLKARGYLKNERAIQAMLATDRKFYIEKDPYQDAPQGIGYGVTISAPKMHGAALEHLAPALQPGNKALDVGSGTGYLTAAIAHMLEIQKGIGLAVGIDIIKPLVEKSRTNVQKHNPALFNCPNFKLLVGDGWKGYPEAAPFNAIHVGAAAESIPEALLDQLAPDGLMFIPVGPSGDQYIQLVKKEHNGTITQKQLLRVRYVPLVKKEDYVPLVKKEHENHAAAAF